MFTKITMVTAAVWILLCVVSVKLLSETDTADLGDGGTPPISGALSDPTDEDAAAGGEDEAAGALGEPAAPAPDGETTP